MASSEAASERATGLRERQASQKPTQGSACDDGNSQDAFFRSGEKEIGSKVNRDDQEKNRHLPNQPRPANGDNSWACPDGTFVKLILETGTGLDKPKEGSLCQVFIEAEPGGPLSYPSQSWAEVELGEGDAEWDGVVDRGLETMLAGERAELRLRGGGSITVHLASFTPVKDSWEMSASEKWNLVIRNKERGSELYRAGDISAAARRYARALRLLVVAAPPPDYDQIKAELHANLAACQLRLRQPANAAANCTKTLALQPANTKALFRRGLAYDAMNDLEGAAQDLKGVLQVEAGNRAARRELERVMERIKARDAKLARAMQKMFS